MTRSSLTWEHGLEDWKVSFRYPDGSVALFYLLDRQGRILSQKDWNETKQCYQSIFVSLGDQVGVQGIFLNKDYNLMISASNGGATLFKDSTEIYMSSMDIKDCYHSNKWAASLRNARQYGSLVYFLASDNSIVEVNMDIQSSSFENCERTTLTMDNLEDFWVEHNVMYAVTSEGCLVQVFLPPVIPRVTQKIVIRKDPQEVDRTFSCIEGCKEYLALSDKTKIPAR